MFQPFGAHCKDKHMLCFDDHEPPAQFFGHPTPSPQKTLDLQASEGPRFLIGAMHLKPPDE